MKRNPVPKVAMVVVDANDASGLSHRDPTRMSPVLHPAVHNLIEGLKARDDFDVEIIYGKKTIQNGEARQEGAVRYVPVSYRPIPIPYLGGAFTAKTLALLRYLGKSQPDLVHGQGTERESGLVAALSRRPSVITLHGNFREIARTLSSKRFSYFWFCARMEHWILPKVSGVHCLSSDTQRSVSGLARRTWIIPNAVASRFFDIHPQPSANPMVVCVAGVTEWKNQLALVGASDPLHEAFPQAEVHFFGACFSDHPYGRAFLDSIESRPWCKFHGQRPSDEVALALTCATCAVLPSKQENFGLALAEAMASGVAVMGANVGGIKDVIADQRTGILFEPDHVGKLGELLVELHHDKEALHRMADAGRKDALERFSVQSVADAHAHMYRQLLRLN